MQAPYRSTHLPPLILPPIAHEPLPSNTPPCTAPTLHKPLPVPLTRSMRTSASSLAKQSRVRRPRLRRLRRPRSGLRRRAPHSPARPQARQGSRMANREGSRCWVQIVPLAPFAFGPGPKPEGESSRCTDSRWTGCAHSCLLCVSFVVSQRPGWVSGWTQCTTCIISNLLFLLQTIDTGTLRTYIVS